MNEEQIQQLAGLHMSSLFFYHLFHQSPDKMWVESLEKESLLSKWPLDLASDEQTILTKLNQSLENDITRLSCDYADLFVGPNRLLAAPWASVYLTAEQLNCGHPTQLIKTFYKKFGIEVDTGEREPEDHIGLMFAFLAYLTHSGLEAVSNDESAQPFMAACRHFLEDHLLTWAPRFLTLVQENAQTDFYRNSSLLCKVMLDQFATLSGAQYKSVTLFR